MYQLKAGDIGGFVLQGHGAAEWPKCLWKHSVLKDSPVDPGCLYFPLFDSKRSNKYLAVIGCF